MMTEQELRDLLSTKSGHDMHPCPTESTGDGFDEEDVGDLLIRLHVLLTQLSRRKLPQVMERDIRLLIPDVEAGLVFYRQM